MHMIYHDAGKRYEDLRRGSLPEVMPATMRPGSNKDPIYRVKKTTDPDGRVWHYLIPFYSVPAKQEGENTVRLLSREVNYQHLRATQRLFREVQMFCIGGKDAHKKYHQLTFHEIGAELDSAQRRKAEFQGDDKARAATEVLYLQVLKLSHLTHDVINDVYEEIRYMSRSIDVMIDNITKRSRKEDSELTKPLYNIALEVLDVAKVVFMRWGQIFHIENTQDTNPDINDPQNLEARKLFKWISYNIEHHPRYAEINNLYQDLMGRKDSEDVIRIPLNSWMRKKDLDTMIQEAISEIYKAFVPNLEFGFYNDRAAKVAQGQCDIDYICETIGKVISEYLKLPHQANTLHVLGDFKNDLAELATKSKLAICIRSKDPNPGLYAQVQMDYREVIWKAKQIVEVIAKNGLDPNKVITPLLELGVNTIENIVSARKSHKQAMQDYKNLYDEVISRELSRV